MIHIVCGMYYWEGEVRNMGGMEYYIYRLSQLLSKRDKVIIYQNSDKCFEIKENDVKVIGTGEKSFKKIIEKIQKSADIENDLLIFASDAFIVSNQFKYSIGIQHGIAWDVPTPKKISDLENEVNILIKAMGSIKKYNRFKKVKHLVCVDYNFVNWYRTQVKYVNTQLHVIPNFSEVPLDIPQKENDHLRIIFARRFVEYRGTRIFAEAIAQVLEKYPQIEVTIAGTGNEEKNWMYNKLKEYKSVTFTNYKAENSLKIHSKHDIAVVPTRGSEGTSLALLEAMAAGCAVIATNVGGITNVLLDGYNGIIIEPSAEALVIELEKLICDRKLCEKLSCKAYETVKTSFSFEKWCLSWNRVIDTIWKK